MKAREVRQIILLIEQDKGKSGMIFSAINTKKDGTERTWNVRLGVTKYLKGGDPAYDAEERNLLTVAEPLKKHYRQMNISTLQKLQVDGKILVRDGKPTRQYREYRKRLK